MAKPPAEVRFPGDKNRRRRLRVRGIKQASREIQRRLESNLDSLQEDPEVFLPDIKCEIGKASFFGPKDPMAVTLREIGNVSSKRNDPKWLRNRMAKRSGDGVSMALAGSLLAASEEDLSTVSVFKSPLYGNASYLKRGNGRPGHLVGIQNYTHTRLRLLVWDDHARSGHYFFSWDGGFVYTGTEPVAPPEWIKWALDNSSVDLSGEESRWTVGLDEGTVKKGVPTEQGWLKLTFSDGTEVGLSQSALSKTDEPLAQSIAMAMMPPNKLGEVCEAEWMWRPGGWPEDRQLPELGEERLGEVLDAWLKMSLEDGALARGCRTSILNSIDDGFVVGNNWFAGDNQNGFLQHMSGTEDERRALSCILDSLQGGVHVRSDGVVLELEENVVRLEDSSCHPVLVSLWPENGMKVLESLFGIRDQEAERVHSKQEKRKQGFGAFLRELGESLSTAMRLDRLPWDSDLLPSPLSFADRLVRKAADDGVASTVSMARSGRGIESAMGWAWLVVHDRTESDAWRFDEESRDKGGDWVPALQSLWDAADSLLLNDNLEAEQDYRTSMGWLAEVSGSGPLP
ncbi:MAG: hypothetical protein VX492_02230 [Candidatus Thermoplasmatota archaeon]|nr:hypothetical protein [Candidatus Thermoplasmatota archaeon]